MSANSHPAAHRNISVYDFELRYFDIRRAPGGIQFTFGPGPEGPVISRLTHKTFIRLYNCTLNGKPWQGPLGNAPNGGMTGIAYRPPTDQDYGFLLVVNNVQGVNGEPDISIVIRWSGIDEDWQKFGRYLRDWHKKLPRPLDTELTEGWQPEDYHLCTECSSPVFDSATSVFGQGRNSPFAMMCEPCGQAVIQEFDMEH